MFVFVCEVGSKVGRGHLTRCEALAQKILARGQQCALLLLRSDTESVRDGISSIWSYSKVVDSFADLVSEAQLMAFARPSIVLIDIYRDDSEIDALGQSFRCHWGRFAYKTPKAFSGQFLISYNTQQDFSAYHQQASIYQGFDYFILKPCFENIALIDKLRHNEKFAFIVMGGGEDRGQLEASYLKVRQHNKQLKIVLVLGQYNPKQINFLDHYNDSQLEVVKNPSNYVELLAASSLVVCAGGTSLIESIALGKASYPVCLSDNQSHLIKHAQDQDLVLDDAGLERLLKDPANSDRISASLSARCLRAELRQGANNLCANLLRIKSRKVV